MKYVLVAFFVLLGVAAALFAGEPVSLDMGNSTYTYTDETVTISSSAVTTIAACTGYRQVKVNDPSNTTTVYFTLGNSSATVTSVGDFFTPTGGVVIEFNGAIYLQLGAGSSSVTLRKHTARR